MNSPYMLSSSFTRRSTTHLRQAARVSPHAYTRARMYTLQHKKGSPVLPILRTLRPERIVDTEQEIIDLSGHCAKTISVPVTHPHWPSSFGPRVLMQASTDPDYINREKFPDNTRGFFYYRRGVPALGGGVRFRVCDDAAGFDAGRDLEVRSRLWQAQPLDITRVFMYRGFIPILLKERLVEEDLLRDAAKIWSDEHGKKHRFYSFSDPFLFDARINGLRLNFITRKGSSAHRFSNMCTDTRHKKHLFPYTGCMWARFEISNLPEHAKKGPCLLLKCLEIVQPIECVIPNYDGYIHPPEPGEYVMRDGRPWFYKLLRQEEKFRDMMVQEGIYPSAPERDRISKRIRRARNRRSALFMGAEKTEDDEA